MIMEESEHDEITHKSPDVSQMPSVVFSITSPEQPSNIKDFEQTLLDKSAAEK